MTARFSPQGEVHKSLPYVIFGSVGIVSLISMYIVMPETKGKTLPEDLPPKRNRKQSTKPIQASPDEEKMDAVNSETLL